MAKSFPNTGATVGLAADRSALTSPFAGMQFFETDTKALYLYNGTAWVESKNYSLSYRPSFQATSNIGNVTVLAADPVPFNITNIDAGSNFNTTTYSFVAPIAGLYLFGYTVYAQAAISLTFYKNSGQLYNNSDVNPLTPVTVAGNAATTTSLASLSVNDAITVRSRTSTSSAIYGQHSVFWGYLIN